MLNSQRIRGAFLAVAAAAFLTIAGCSNQATNQATNQAPPPPKKAAAAKPASKPAAPKTAAKKPEGKVVAAKAPAPKPAPAKTASTKTVSAKPVSSKVASNKVAQQTNFVTIPQGTAVRATVSQALASNKNHSGDAFAAILSSPIKVDGKTIVPKGAHVSGRVVTAKKSGPAELTVALTSVQVDGKSYKLATEPINHTGKAAKEGDESAKPEKDITVAAQSHLKFKLAKPAKIPVKS
jgi:hypothetical protein